VTIALVVLLLIDLAVALVLLAVLGRRRQSITSRRGAFKGKLRVVEGEVDGLSARWAGGYGYWVRDVLVWDSAPFLGRAKLIPIDGTDVSGIHQGNGTITNLGRHPIVTPLLSDNRARLELAACEEDRDLVLGPFARTSAIGSLVRARLNEDDLYPNDN
jgi:hypothetical protein